MGGGDMPDDGVGKEAKVKIRSANGSKFYVHANLNSTVVNFKSIVAQKCHIPAQQQRLIHKGRVMKDDQTLRSYGLEGDHTVYLVRGFATAAAADSTSTNTTDAGIQNSTSTSTNNGSNVGRRRGRPPFGPSFFPELDPDGPGLGAVPEIEQMQEQLVQNRDIVRNILNILTLQDLINSPEIVRNMIMNNSQMRDVMGRNPELEHILNDPANLRQTMDAAHNPESMREMMRNTDRAMSNIEASPLDSKFSNILRQTYEHLEQPSLNAMTLTEDDSSNSESDPYETLFGTQTGRTGTENFSSSITPVPENTINSPAPNTNPLPNPWAYADGGILRNSGALGNPIGNTMADSPGVLYPDFEVDSTPDLTVSNETNELMQDPVISQTMRNMLSNPQYLNQMLGFNPRLQNVLDSNPQIRDMMQDPQFIRRVATPRIVHELLNYHRGLVSQASEEEAQNDGETVGDDTISAGRELERLMNLFAGLTIRAGITPAPAPASIPRGPPEEQYATQLSQLQEMGFFDTQENIRALIATAGNVHAAVERLLGN